MPKRKRHDEDQMEFLLWKVKKLERKLGHRRRSRSKSKHRERRSRSRSRSNRPRSCDMSPSAGQHDKMVEELLGSLPELARSTEATDEAVEPEQCNHPPQDNDSTANVTTVEPSNEPANADDTIDSDLLEILGNDPSAAIEYGKDIHFFSFSFSKEARKELNEKYLLAENCAKVGAPVMNPEIKAALTEIVVKRDKGIETRQKQLASAITGLAELLNRELESKEKDSTRLKQLMDVCRILCDIQHAESVTRRNFAIFSIKKELKEHLVITKIDKTLFGENLADTLKSAKAVSKSGSELKTKPPPRPKPSTPSTSNLNWKSPAPARKQQQQQSAARGREAAAAPPPAPGPVARSSRNTTHGYSSKPSHYPPKQTRRR